MTKGGSNFLGSSVMIKTKHPLLVLFVALALFTNLHSETNVVEPTGALKEVDTSVDIKAIEQLLGSDKKKAASVAEKVETEPSRYSPPVFYAMSTYLFNEGEKESAMRWFYAGQVRARYDANRCTDKSASSAVGVLNQQFGTPINQYAFQEAEIEVFERTVREAISWSLETPHEYDQRWINLHGMGAFTGASSNQPSLPESEWEAVRQKTHKEYLEGFEQALQQLKNRL